MRKLVICIVLAMFCVSAYGAEFLGKENGKYKFFDNGIERLCTQPESFDNGRTAITECKTGDKIYICVALPSFLGFLDCNARPKGLQVFI